MENIMSFSYKFAKGISFILIVVSLVVFVGSTLFLVFSSSDGFRTPEFGEVLQSDLGVSRLNNNDYSGTEERRKIEKEYGDQVLNIVKINKLPDKKYNNIIRGLVKLDENYQSDFVNGLERFLDDASVSGKENKVDYNIETVMNEYIQAFEYAMNREVHSKAENEMKQLQILGVMGVSLLLFIIIIIIPVLIKIEENTRRQG